MTNESIVYRLEHATATVELTLGAGRLGIRTCGVGLLDRPRVDDVRTSDASAYAVVPTIGVQHLAGRQGSAGAADSSYDSELLIVLQVDGAPVRRRMFVDSRDPQFRRLIAQLDSQNPAANLGQLDPEEARRRMGFASPRKTVIVILFALIGLPILVALLMLAYTLLTEM